MSSVIVKIMFILFVFVNFAVVVPLVMMEMLCKGKPFSYLHCAGISTGSEYCSWGELWHDIKYAWHEIGTTF